MGLRLRDVSHRKTQNAGVGLTTSWVGLTTSWVGLTTSWVALARSGELSASLLPPMQYLYQYESTISHFYPPSWPYNRFSSQDSHTQGFGWDR